MGFPDGSMVENLPANAGEAHSILGQDDPLEKEMATHSGILAWRIPWTEEPGGLQSAESQSWYVTGHKSQEIASVQFSRSVVSDSLRPYELQHARPPCPSPTLRVHSNSCPSSR